MELKFRKLRANEIECRVGNVAKDSSGFSLLLYKDARVDMALLDEIVGQGNWQREHKILGNDIYCRVGVFNKDLNCWVWVEDAGASGSIEIEKSKASDSFKRACVNLGIGRELYTSPFIWVKKDQDNTTATHYVVKEIDYKDNEISKLVIVNEKTGQVVFSKGSTTKVSQTTQKAPQKANDDLDSIINSEQELVSGDDLLFLQAYVGNLGGTEYNQFFTWLESKYGVKTITKLTKEQGKKIAYYLKNRNR